MTSVLKWYGFMGDILRELLASHTQPLVFKNMSPPEISSLRLSRQAEEMEQGVLLNYPFWTCCQPARLLWLCLTGHPTLRLESGGKQLRALDEEAWKVAEKDGKPGCRISCRESNIIDSIIRSGVLRKKTMTCLQNSLAENTHDSQLC